MVIPKSSTKFPLPTELLLNIFDLIKDKRQLARCRRVCAGWKPLVEIVMYKEVNLGGLRQIEMFAQHLEERPDLSHHIQRLTHEDHNEPRTTIQRILRAALTPNIQILDGYWSRRDIAIARQVIESSADKFDKLQELPRLKDCDNKYMKMMMLCAKSLKKISLRIETFTSSEDMAKMCNMMVQCANLTTLDIKNWEGLGTVYDLNNLLEKCSNLKRLKLTMHQDGYTQQKDDELNDWLSRNVEKVVSLKHLTIVMQGGQKSLEKQLAMHGFCPDWIQLLDFKYPNISTLLINNEKYNYALKLPNFANLKKYDLHKLKIFKKKPLQSLVNQYKTSSNSVTVDQQWLCAMDIKGSRDWNRTDFKLHLKGAQKEDVIAAQLKTVLSSLDVHHLILKPCRGVNTLPLFTSLMNTPLLKTLTIRGATTIDSTFTDVMNLAILNTVYLCEVCITPRTTECLSQFAPNIKFLELLNCDLKQKVNVPFNHLNKLTIQEDSRINFDFTRMRGNTFIQITMSAISHQVCLLARPGKDLVEISPREFHLFSDEFNRIQVVCNSLKQLDMDLDVVKFKVAFDEYGKIREWVHV